MSSARLPSGGGRQRQRGGCHTQTHIHSNNSHGHDWSLCGGTDINTHYPCTQNTGNVICRRVEASHQYSEQNMSSEKLFVCLPTEHTCLTVHHTLHWLSFFLNANSQFKEHVKTPVPRKWKTSKRFQEGKKINAKVVQRRIHTPVSERAQWTPLAWCILAHMSHLARKRAQDCSFFPYSCLNYSPVPFTCDKPGWCCFPSQLAKETSAQAW